MSTRAVVNAWESGANSSRESLGPNQQGSRIGQHLNRLHKKAQDQENNSGPRSQSVMSNMTHPSSSFNSSTARRASDPGRVLDRNFGVNGQLSRHRSGSYAGANSQQENPQSYQVKSFCKCLPHEPGPYLTSVCSYYSFLRLLLKLRVTNPFHSISKISIMERGNSMVFNLDLATITIASIPVERVVQEPKLLSIHQVLLQIGTINNGIIGIIMVPTQQLSKNLVIHKQVLTKGR